MKVNNAIASVAGWRRLGTLLALAVGLNVTAVPLPAMGEFPYQVSLQTSSLDSSGGGDIIVFDIIDSVAKTDRAAGGGGGGNIIIFDIVDSVAKTNRPAGDGGGDIIVFDIIDSVARIYVSTKSSAPGVHLAILAEGERKLLGLVSFEEPSPGLVGLKFIF